MKSRPRCSARCRLGEHSDRRQKRRANPVLTVGCTRVRTPCRHFARERFRVLPCAGAEAGLHRGLGRGLDETVKAAGGSRPFFSTPFASFRAEGAWEALFVEVEGEGELPLDHHRFYFNTTPVENVTTSLLWPLVLLRNRATPID